MIFLPKFVELTPFKIEKFLIKSFDEPYIKCEDDPNELNVNLF